MITCLQDAYAGSCNLVDLEQNTVSRRMDCLGDYVIDYAYEVLDKRASDISFLFDHLDLIILGGDMHVMPWEPRFSQVVTLLDNCKKVNKPVICGGVGAFGLIYSACSGGTKFHVLNGPHGDSIDKLPSYPRYGTENGQYPSTFLDNKTGDMYCYEPHRKVWSAYCNIGMYRRAGGSGEERPPTRSFVSNV